MGRRVVPLDADQDSGREPGGRAAFGGSSPGACDGRVMADPSKRTQGLYLYLQGLMEDRVIYPGMPAGKIVVEAAAALTRDIGSLLAKRTTRSFADFLRGLAAAIDER